MILRPFRSTLIICFFVFLNLLVAFGIWAHRSVENWGEDSAADLDKIPTELRELEYFHLKDQRPSLSLVADLMQSLGDDLVRFDRPRGTYAGKDSSEVLRYEAREAEFVKEEDLLKLYDDVRLEQGPQRFEAQELSYRVKAGVVEGRRKVKLWHRLTSSGQQLTMAGETLRARPRERWALLGGGVSGQLRPRFDYQAPLNFAAQSLELLGGEGLLRLSEDVRLRRGDLDVSSRNGEVYLEQGNKKLKYFILNDDVKVREKLVDSRGQSMVREAFAERLEGFGQDKLVLSGAPRVVQDKDTVKGYRITMREKMEYIEVEDALSDVQVRQDAGTEKKKRAKER